MGKVVESLSAEKMPSRCLRRRRAGVNAMLMGQGVHFLYLSTRATPFISTNYLPRFFVFCA